MVQVKEYKTILQKAKKDLDQNEKRLCFSKNVKRLEDL